ncbi:hypothetical protein [Chryseobacterium sp. MA9]|uniref:hypothetical protein n=1 Tax=Chryseobacterium sp. MA9 TaxID=2966625 RepID=UPI002102685D|nr:hypothetical protein [Chryseobacterium sp. MA9]UTX49855.1 hypothetical protein KIK00_06225 [Chryseobacterium sp. MA9]
MENYNNLILKQKKILHLKTILSNLNVMILDDNLPFVITMIPNKKHIDYEDLKVFLENRTLPEYNEFLPQIEDFLGSNSE